MKLDTIREHHESKDPFAPRLFKTTCKACGGPAVTSRQLQATKCSGCLRRDAIERGREARERRRAAW